VRLLLCALLSPERHGEQQYGAIKLKGTIKKNLALRARPHFLPRQALEELGLGLEEPRVQELEGRAKNIEAQILHRNKKPLATKLNTE